MYECSGLVGRDLSQLIVLNNSMARERNTANLLLDTPRSGHAHPVESPNMEDSDTRSRGVWYNWKSHVVACINLGDE